MAKPPGGVNGTTRGKSSACRPRQLVYRVVTLIGNPHISGPASDCEDLRIFLTDETPKVAIGANFRHSGEGHCRSRLSFRVKHNSPSATAVSRSNVAPPSESATLRWTTAVGIHMLPLEGQRHPNPGLCLQGRCR